MLNPTKKQRIEEHHHHNEVETKNDEDLTATFNLLGTDELANTFGYRKPEVVMCARLNKKMKDAATKTSYPKHYYFDNMLLVDSFRKYNVLAAMITAMPNLQYIQMSELNGSGFHLYSDGADPDEPDEQSYNSADFHSIEIVSNFRMLHVLQICRGAELNGRYPLLFNFPLLEELHLVWVKNLKWGLEESLGGLPSLKILHCVGHKLTDTLVEVHIKDCSGVHGSFMDLADFPHLKELDLTETPVKGDIQEIGERDFQTLESLSLPSCVYGGSGFEVHHISDAPDVAGAIYALKQHHPNLFMPNWYAKLAEDSPDWYEGHHRWLLPQPPFKIEFVQAGSRLGWRWMKDTYRFQCEVNWLDSEPDRDDSDYEQYIQELRRIKEETTVYKGFFLPPSAEEYRSLILYRYGPTGY